MKTVICNEFGPVENLTWGERESPPLAEDEVRVGVRAAAVNFMDILMVQGLYQLKPPLPFAPGTDAAGEVLEVGAAVRGIKPGDRVVAGGDYGAYAEEMVVKAEGGVFLMPDGVDFAVGAAHRGAYGSALYALEQRANLQKGEVLLVHGAAGGLGLAAVELGVLMGARVIGTVGSAKKMAIVRRFGAGEVIDYSTESIRDRVKELTGGQGADVIFDVVGGDVFDQSLRCINWGGRLLVLGFTSGTIPSAPANLALLKSCAIVGVFYGAWTSRFPEQTRALHHRLLGWCAEGRIHPHISQTFPLEQAAQAMGLLASRKATGKVMLQVG